jgi:hypothetical protein
MKTKEEILERRTYADKVRHSAGVNTPKYARNNGIVNILDWVLEEVKT